MFVIDYAFGCVFDTLSEFCMNGHIYHRERDLSQYGNSRYDAQYLASSLILDGNTRHNSRTCLPT